MVLSSGCHRKSIQFIFVQSFFTETVTKTIDRVTEGQKGKGQTPSQSPKISVAVVMVESVAVLGVVVMVMSWRGVLRCPGLGFGCCSDAVGLSGRGAPW